VGNLRLNWTAMILLAPHASMGEPDNEEQPSNTAFYVLVGISILITIFWFLAATGIIPS
jgi:hypothetical protein